MQLSEAQVEIHEAGSVAGKMFVKHWEYNFLQSFDGGLRLPVVIGRRCRQEDEVRSLGFVGEAIDDLSKLCAQNIM